jgi:hypothetical protein
MALVRLERTLPLTAGTEALDEYLRPFRPAPLRGLRLYFVLVEPRALAVPAGGSGSARLHIRLCSMTACQSLAAGLRHDLPWFHAQENGPG